MVLQEEFGEFALEVGGEEVLAEGLADFVEGPEAASVEFFCRGFDGAIVDGTMHINQFALSTALEDVLPYPFWGEVGDAKFLTYLSY